MIGDPGDTVTALAAWSAWRAAQFDSIIQAVTDATIDTLWALMGISSPPPRLDTTAILEEIL